MPSDGDSPRQGIVQFDHPVGARQGAGRRLCQFHHRPGHQRCCMCHQQCIGGGNRQSGESFRQQRPRCILFTSGQTQTLQTSGHPWVDEWSDADGGCAWDHHQMGDTREHPVVDRARIRASHVHHQGGGDSGATQRNPTGRQRGCDGFHEGVRSGHRDSLCGSVSDAPGLVGRDRMTTQVGPHQRVPARRSRSGDIVGVDDVAGGDQGAPSGSVVRCGVGGADVASAGGHGSGEVAGQWPGEVVQAQSNPAAGVDQNREPGVQTQVIRGSHAMDGDPK